MTSPEVDSIADHAPKNGAPASNGARKSARSKTRLEAKRSRKRPNPKRSAPNRKTSGGDDSGTVSAKAEKKRISPINYPPYVNAYNAIPTLFAAIRGASVPPKFTLDFLESVLGMKSTSHRALIPLLKRLGLLDQANVPTEKYRLVRDDDSKGRVMAEQVRSAYSDLYRANEYAHRLSRPEIAAKLRSVLGAASDDPVIPSVAGTYQELVKQCDFSAESTPEVKGRVRASADAEETLQEDEAQTRDTLRGRQVTYARQTRELGISYTINLNLPATADINVFNAIFKSLREHILNED